MVALCSTCGRILNPKGECLACLLRSGFEHPLEIAASTAFGDYELARREDGSLWELGRGAMGVTYRAHDRPLNRDVALKVIDAQASGGEAQPVRDRFLREARAAAAFHHPNVAGVFHFGASQDGTRCYYAMELVEGETLEALVRRDGPLTVESALEITTQVTRALIAAASHDLIHRDLKPGNIMLTQTGGTTGVEVKVIDFGLAKVLAEDGEGMDLTRGNFIGTPAFASPEQFCGARADARSDIYSLGVTLWYALTGEVPFAGKSIEEIRQCPRDLALLVRQLSARKIPTPVIQLLRRVLALDPSLRPSSASELMTALERCRSRPGLIPGHQSRAQRTRRNVAAVLVLITVAAAAFFVFRLPPPKATSPPPFPAKSIAVLPFENLSAEEENAYFADGVQDDILSALSKVDGLKVISRTSVMSYKAGAKRNLREIGEALRVAHILEGSVRRAGGKVRVTTQLIDARSETHLWADTYDRDLADVFAIQSDIALRVAEALQATLSPMEKSALEQPATKDVAAYELYSRARVLHLTANFGPFFQERMEEAVSLLDRAGGARPGISARLVRAGQGARPSLFCRLRSHAGPARSGRECGPERAGVWTRRRVWRAWLWRSISTVATGITIAPGANWKTPAARCQTTPGFSSCSALSTAARDAGRSPLAASNVRSSRSAQPGHARADRGNYSHPADAIRMRPQSWTARWRSSTIRPHERSRAALEADRRADLQPLHADDRGHPGGGSGSRADVGGRLALTWPFVDAIPAAATRALAALTSDAALTVGHMFSNRPSARGRWPGCAAMRPLRGRRLAMPAASRKKRSRGHPGYGPSLRVLGLIDAALGRKEEALAEGRRGMELLPIERDASTGADAATVFAMICAWTGERPRFQHLHFLTEHPTLLSYGELNCSRGGTRCGTIRASRSSSPGCAKAGR